MVTFRKSLLLLAVIAMTTAVVNAQIPGEPFACTATAGVPPLVRAEGLAEMTGDILMTCKGGVPTALGEPVPKVNVRVFYNTFVTSKVLNNSMMTESLLMIDDPAPAEQQLCDWNVADACGITGVGAEPGVDYATVNNVFPGKLITGNVIEDANTIDWNGIPIDPPGTNAFRIIRITNVRANAARLGVGGGFFGSQIQAVVSLTSSTSIPVNQTALTVGFVQEGLKVSNGSQNYLQCEPDGDVAISLTFKEQFGTAFKPKGAATQNVPGAIYNAENNFVNPAFPSPYEVAGVASQATRLIAKFTNVPAGVTLLLSGQNSSPSPTDYWAQVVSGADANGMGGTLGTSDITITPSGGAATATWEVVASNPTTLQNYVFTVTPNYTPNVQSGIPGLGSGLVAGSYGPLLNQPKYIPYGSTQVVPRFIDDSGDPAIFMTVNSCATNLLYPYIVNQGSFDTGIIISNTSDDPFLTANQTGSCDLYFYGNTDGGLAPDVYETPVVPAGAFAAFTLSGGGAVATDGTVTVVDNEIAAFPGFAGYMIAHCRFQYAHGYAFISDMGAQKLAQGYIALVLDDSIDFAKGSRTGSKSEPLNQ